MNLNKIQDKIAIVFNNLEHKEDTENADLLAEVINDIKALSVSVDNVWIKLKDRVPSEKTDGKKVLVFRIMNKGQKSQAISVLSVALIKYSNKDETWWLPLPSEPQT